MANVKYNKEIADRIITAIKDGGSQRAAAKKVGIAEETVCEWKKKFPAFREAVERAHGEAQVEAEQSLFHKATTGNVPALIFWLKNRHSSEWRDVQRREIAVTQTFEDWVAALTAPAQGQQPKETDHDDNTH